MPILNFLFTILSGLPLIWFIFKTKILQVLGLNRQKIQPSKFKYQSFPAGDPGHVTRRNKTGVACQRYRDLPEDVPASTKAAFWMEICPYTVGAGDTEILPGRNVPIVKQPIYVDYGDNVKIHPSVFINRNVMIFDTPNTTIEIGENTAIGAGCKIIAVEHPRDIENRKKGLRKIGSGGRPIKIGKNVRVFVDSIILPGSIIGDNSIVNARSVINGVIPPNKFTDGKFIRDLPKKFT